MKCSVLDGRQTDRRQEKMNKNNQGTNLFMGYRSLFLIGQLHASAYVGAQICLAAYEKDSSARAEVLNLCFPLQREETRAVTRLSFERGRAYYQPPKGNRSSSYLLQRAVYRVRSADVKAQQHCIRVTVAERSNIVVVWRTWRNGESDRV